MKKILISSLLLAANISIGKEFKIGVIGPVTGPLAAYGQAVNEGVKIASELQPALSNGNKIKLVLVDNRSDKAETANAMAKLLDQGVVGIIGPLTSSNAKIGLSQANKKKIPLIFPVATNDKLIRRNSFGNRICFSDSFQGEVAADYAIERKLNTAVVIVDQANTYSVGLARRFQKVFVQKGGTVLETYKITQGDRDFKAIAAQIKAKNPKVIFTPIYDPEGVPLIVQIRQIGVKAPTLSGDSMSNEAFIKNGGKAIEGHLLVDFFHYENPPTQRSKDYIQAFRTKTGKKIVSAFNVMGADAYNLLVNAVNKCVDRQYLDGSCVNTAIKNTVKYEGVSGVISIDKNGNAVRSAVIKEIVNGKQEYRATVNPNS